MNRRDFFRRCGGKALPIRPPWAVEETAFRDACSGCGACVKACPQGILAAGPGGLPMVEFERGFCTFCGACADVCEDAAFLPRDSGDAPWQIKAAITSDCLETQGVVCRACETACEAAALRFRPQRGGRTQVLVDAAACTGCGACRGVCPVAAIKMSATESAVAGEAQPHPQPNRKSQEDAA